MAVIYTDGFDAYGPTGNTCLIGSGSGNIAPQLVGGWTTAYGFGTIEIAAPLSTTGYAISLTEGSISQMYIYKNLGTPYPRLIGGFRFSSNLGGNAGITMARITNDQWSCYVTQTGTIIICTGGVGGTIINTGAVITQNSTHYLEFDVTVGSDAPYYIWLDGALILTGTGNTRGDGTNNNADGLYLVSGDEDCTMIFDDLYLFDDTGTTNNAALLTSPRIETTWPTADNRTNFTNGASILGEDYNVTGNSNAPGANTLFLRQFTPAVAVNLNSVSCMPANTSGTANFKAVAYGDNSGSPHTLLSSGTQVTGCTAGTLLTGNLVSPPVLTAGTPYWIGFITDTSIALLQVDTSETGQKATNTYTSGAPSTAPTMTPDQLSWQLFGNLTGATTNWTSENVNPTAFDASYVYSNVSGDEDLYTFGALSSTPSQIYTVGVKGMFRKTDTGARTVSLRTKSGTTDTAGSNPGQAMATTYGWLDSYWDTDPNTSAAWTEAGLNAAVSGPQVAS